LQGSPCSRWNAQVPLAVPKFLEIPNYSLDRVFCHDDSGSDARVSGTIRTQYYGRCHTRQRIDH